MILHFVPCASLRDAFAVAEAAPHSCIAWTGSGQIIAIVVLGPPERGA